MLAVHVGALRPKIGPDVAFTVARLGAARRLVRRMETIGMGATRKLRVNNENCVTRRAFNVSGPPN